MKVLSTKLTQERQEKKTLFLWKLKHLKKEEGELPPREELLAEYLKEIHGIDVPKDFSKMLKQAHLEHHGTAFNMSFDIVDSVVVACSLWGEYIAKTVDYNNLICQQVLSMARIHTSVIATRDILKTGIQLRKQPDYRFSVQVSYDGMIVVYY